MDMSLQKAIVAGDLESVNSLVKGTGISNRFGRFSYQAHFA